MILDSPVSLRYVESYWRLAKIVVPLPNNSNIIAVINDEPALVCKRLRPASTNAPSVNCRTFHKRTIPLPDDVDLSCFYEIQFWRVFPTVWLNCTATMFVCSTKRDVTVVCRGHPSPSLNTKIGEFASLQAQRYFREFSERLHGPHGVITDLVNSMVQSVAVKEDESRENTNVALQQLPQVLLSAVLSYTTIYDRSLFRRVSWNWNNILSTAFVQKDNSDDADNSDNSVCSNRIRAHIVFSWSLVFQVIPAAVDCASEIQPSQAKLDRYSSGTPSPRARNFHPESDYWDDSIMQLLQQCATVCDHIVFKHWKLHFNPARLPSFCQRSCVLPQMRFSRGLTVRVAAWSYCFFRDGSETNLASSLIEVMDQNCPNPSNTSISKILWAFDQLKLSKDDLWNSPQWTALCSCFAEWRCKPPASPATAYAFVTQTDKTRGRNLILQTMTLWSILDWNNTLDPEMCIEAFYNCFGKKGP
ncbi:uncharacterized protein LOC129602124 [Paramacrobiotus metropolitanus]|uniref:uncharacterized protein LOC129602124 n=1 Tax=Paramacrobiotus metropolitanus TaxID=2943436 RepID=UPI00244600D3|nr:uncharacterized protein LOC129602124 [Paramacrobiotus metropolitanus]